MASWSGFGIPILRVSATAQPTRETKATKEEVVSLPSHFSQVQSDKEISETRVPVIVENQEGQLVSRLATVEELQTKNESRKKPSIARKAAEKIKQVFIPEE